MADLTPDRTPEGWSRVADAYDGAVAPELAKYAADVLRLTDLQPGERVLDVAAGSGALAFLAAERGARVLATDFAPDMIARLRANVAARKADVRAEVMDGQALAVEGGTFDAAYSNFGLIFFPDRVKGLREMRRALRDGGRAGVTGWSAPDRIGWFRLFGEAMHEVAPDLPPPPEPPAVFSWADPAKLAAEMREAGFRDVRVETVRHTWTIESIEGSWASLTTTNPVVPVLLQRLGDARATAFRDAYLRRLRAVARDGRVGLVGEAHVGIGVK